MVTSRQWASIRCYGRQTTSLPQPAITSRLCTDTKLYCLVREARRCEQLVQACYPIEWRPGFELVTIESQVQSDTARLLSDPPLHFSSLHSETFFTTGKTQWCEVRLIAEVTICWCHIKAVSSLQFGISQSSGGSNNNDDQSITEFTAFSSIQSFNVVGWMTQQEHLVCKNGSNYHWRFSFMACHITQ